MIRRWARSRTWRKFMRQKLALGALFIAMVYVLTGFAVFCGALTLDDTQNRIGSNSQPGFFLKADPEKRLRNASIIVNDVDRALAKPDPDTALSEIELGHYRIAKRSHTEMRELVDNCWEIIDELEQSEDLAEEPGADAKLDELDTRVQRLFGELEGTKKLHQWVAELAGTDRQGRSIMLRGIYSIKVALQIGVVTALISVVFGTALGSAAGYFGGIVDHCVIWLYSTIASIPNLVLLVLLAYLFTGTRADGTLVPVYVAFCATFWIGPCRVIRGETMKLKELEFVQAAKTVGFNGFYILGRHLIPNMVHLMLINFSLLLIGAIKSEVILSFLGLGVSSGASWGIMINDSKPEVLNGFFWQIGTATFFMFVLVLAFNLLSDALQDVFDPKHN